MNRRARLSNPRHARLRRLLPAFATFLATLAAVPVQAVTIPNLPLQTGTAYPPANVVFILDDSGSMTYSAMPNDISSFSSLDDDITDKSYVYNTIYYNPATSYLPWIKADGTRYTGGTDYDSAYSSNNYVGSSSYTTDLSDDTQTYFVPKSGTTDYSDQANYYRYQLRSVTGDGQTGTRVVRSEYLAPLTTTSTLLTESSLSRSKNDNPRYVARTVTVAAGQSILTVATSGGSGDADIYVYFDGDRVCSNTSNGNDRSCSVNNPDAGTYTIQVYAEKTYSGVSLSVTTSATDVRTGVANAGCSTSTSGSNWRNCTFATPTGRTESEELTNFATWYSYHRTRIKVAKAGASDAFSQLGSSVRVGYDSIWNRNRYKIPVGNDNGLFRGDNRTDWFDHMQSAAGNNGTPLHGALQRTGNYFEDTTASGPWGPETGSDQLSCRQNFAILTTDGYWNDYSGYSSSAIGDADATDGDPITSEDGKTTLQYKAVSPYKDNFKYGSTLYSKSNTLADVANYYWKRDLVTSLANDVPTSSADLAFWQHMVTFGVSIGLQGRLNPKSDLQAITDGSKNWGDPTDREDLDRVDDLWHASVNGHGNFVAATKPDEFVSGLVAALATVAQRLGSASNVTANSTSFQTDTRVYQASYVSGLWTGELAAYEVSSAGISTVDANGDGVPDSVWNASEHIPAFGDRKIFTSTGAAGASFPTSSQSSAMAKTRSDVNGGNVSGEENAAYVAGSQDMEIQNGGKLRDRASLLGDIANSSPMYVKESETIYVGANDGMLHGFDALTGAELFAYVPAGLDFGQLGNLSDPQYSPSHQYFVDGPVVVSSNSQTPGKNYLVGSLGRGGKGVYGLDVTTPTTFSTASVAWDKTGTALGDDMGQVLGEPLFVTLNKLDPDTSQRMQAVVVSNGINSTNGHAVLFVLDVTDGTVVAKIDTGIGSDNGLSAPRGADVDGDGDVDYVYAGDLKGNIWKFNLNNANSSTWDVSNGGSPLFSAVDSDGTAQPITAGLAIARDPATSKVWIFAGTGSFMTSSDISNTNVQTMYGLIDDGTEIGSRDDLVERSIIVAKTQDGNDVRGFEASTTMPSDKRGWYVDLDTPSAGERVVSNPRVRGAVLLFASMIPPQENTCDAGGTGYVNAIDPFTGSSLTQPYFDSNGDGKVDEDDSVTSSGGTVVPVGSIDLGVGMPTLPTLIDKLLVVGGSKGTLGSVVMNPQGGSARRISWREILRD
jgi:type IV pilus assembly protein PilY1